MDRRPDRPGPRDRGTDQDAGVSPVVGTVLLLIIIIGVVAVIFALALPQIRTLQAQAEARTALTAIQRLDEAMGDLALNPPTRSDEVDVTVPTGGLTLRPDRVRWAVSYSSDQDRRYNFSVGGLGDTDHVYNVTTHGVTDLAPVSGLLTARHTLWRAGVAEAVDPVTFSIPAPGEPAPVPVEDGGRPVNLTGVLLEVVLVADDGTVVGGAWVADSWSVRYEATLFTGPHAYEAVLAAVVREEARQPPRLDGFDAVRVAFPDRPRPLVSASLLRQHVPSGATVGVGAGQVRVTLEARPPFALVDDEVKGNVTFSPSLAHADLFEARLAEVGLTVDEGTGRIYHPGHVRLVLTDHVVSMPHGLARR